MTPSRHGLDPRFFASLSKFSPERWLNQVPDTLARMNRVSLPFAMGSRGCFGMQ